MDIHTFIRNLDVKTLVEIGAHFAEDTVVFRASHPNARIVAFEPDPRNLALIRSLGRDHMPQGVEYKCLQFFPSCHE